jgi:hypothetical protein
MVVNISSTSRNDVSESFHSVLNVVAGPPARAKPPFVALCLEKLMRWVMDQAREREAARATRDCLLLTSIGNRRIRQT